MPENAKLKAFLDKGVEVHNSPDFIESDPISIPHLFRKKEDIEISAFLTASISWGNRKAILNNARRLMKAMDMAPCDFVTNYSDRDFKSLKGYVHRTFNDTDLLTFILCLKSLYLDEKGLEGLFSEGDLESSLRNFHTNFFCVTPASRTRKHVADISRNSAAKRLNMFLRWMVRKDDNGVDFGIWKGISPSSLFIPLDVHSGRTARDLGLLVRKQNDWKAVLELTEVLRKLDPSDPVKYDFSLFGMSLSGNPLT